MTSSGSHY